MSQPSTLPLRGETTLESALDQEEDMHLDLSYPDQRVDFFVWLYSHRSDIEETVSHHLGLGPRNCRVGGVNEWIHGSFNVCLPVYVDQWTTGKRVLVRFPLPYKVGESTCPGNADEKLRCEAATFIWIQEHGYAVPIPRLGIWICRRSERTRSGHPCFYHEADIKSQFTRPENTPLATWLIWFLGRSVSWLLGYPLPCSYITHRRRGLLGHGYLIMDYVDDQDVQMLSETWDDYRHHQEKRSNLFRDLSRVMLSLSRTPTPCIGSWTLDSNGFLRLSNRPLTLRLHQLENGGILTDINRSATYPTADSYYLDLLSCHDSRIRRQPNSVNDEDDARAQMANLAAMRALLPHFTDRKLRQGPFLYRLTDLHQSNIFVDSNWRIKFLVDLEWACSLPAETLRPPYWLTGRPVDDLIGEHHEAFNKTYHEFVDIFEEEEKSMSNDCSRRANIMRKSWEIGSFWYFHALDSPKGLFNLFRDHIQPLFSESHRLDPEYPRIVSEYWAKDTEEVIAAKLRDRETYESALRRRFEDASDSSC